MTTGTHWVRTRIYHKLNEKVQLAATGSFDLMPALPAEITCQAQPPLAFSFAAQYNIDNAWTLRAKVNNKAELSWSTVNKLTPRECFRYFLLNFLSNFLIS